ncbi:MAG: heavy-metal-associated domain-containing protein [Magnetospirillum sp. WYHS-4]
MASYVHHVPGRLRVRLASVKRNERRARRVSALLEELPGVESVEISTVTGSVTVVYDQAETDASHLFQALRREGHMNSEIAASGEPDNWQDLASKAGENFGKFMLGMAVEKVIERSAVALVAAII